MMTVARCDSLWVPPVFLMSERYDMYHDLTMLAALTVPMIVVGIVCCDFGVGERCRLYSYCYYSGVGCYDRQRELWYVFVYLWLKYCFYMIDSCFGV